MMKQSLLTIEIQESIMQHMSGKLDIPGMIVLHNSLLESGAIWALPHLLDECGTMLQHGMIGKRNQLIN